MTKTPDGIRVVDVWQSRADFDKHAQEKIGPITQEWHNGAARNPVFEVHNYLTAG